MKISTGGAVLGALGLSEVLLALAKTRRRDMGLREDILRAFASVIDDAEHTDFPDGVPYNVQAQAVRESVEYLSEVRDRCIVEIGKYPD